MDSESSASKTSKHKRFTQRFRSVLDRSASASPNHLDTAPKSVTLASSSTTATRLNADIGSGVLKDALEKLGQDERETIQIYLSSNTSNINDALNVVRGAAVKLQQDSQEKRWHWSYEGREIYLRDHMDKVIKLLDKFKSAGDIIANVDPIHVGLPWAGLRTLLEVAMSDSTQRAALVTGLELSLLMSNRLKAYQHYLVRLTASLAKDNFRKALVELYAHVLEFLARAIHILYKNSTARICDAVWNAGNLAKFEDKCDKLCEKVEAQASQCNRHEFEQWKEKMDTEMKALHEIHNIGKTVDKIDQRTGLMNLETARGATHNSRTEDNLGRCLPDTRVEILARITNWSYEEKGKKIFWLCGKAGTGKSTISRTVATILDEAGFLGASFFFKRGREDRSHAGLIFPTIARQLADRFPDMRNVIIAALDNDSLLCERDLAEQYKKLLLQPLQSNFQISISPRNVIVVIDALDECDSDDDIKAILYHLSKIDSVTSIRLMIFVTSRPELPVELGFRKMSGNLHIDVRLEEAQAISIARDISIFYESEFAKVRENSSQDIEPLPIEWPGKDRIQRLVELAGQLFIFAFTITRYISEDDARERLTLILGQDKSLLIDLQGTYLPILNQLITQDDEQQNQTRIANFKTIVGSIVLLNNPLSASSLSQLLAIHVGKIDRILRPLHSVLNIPTTVDRRLDPDTAITLFHLSFRDFLVDATIQNSNRFWIDEVQTHNALAFKCIRLLSSGILKEDICDVRKPGIRRANVTKEYITQYLPDAVVYACRYWIDHVISSGGQGTNDNDHIFEFLKKHFLHWMEAMSWLGKAAEVILQLEKLQTVIDIDQGVQHLRFLDDASRFALRNRAVVDLAPLQTYLSALLFAPSKSIIRRSFGSILEKYLDIFPKVPKQWNAERLKLEGHENWVSAVAISTDGKTVASGSHDTTVRLWSTATGEQMLKLEGHENWVSAVAISTDGKTVASGSDDKTVRLWSTATGEQTLKLEGHENSVSAVAISADGKTVASGSYDRTVRLWSTATGEQTLKLEGHENSVSAVAISADGKTVASGSHDKTVRLWSTATGEQTLKLEGHENSVSAVAISADGKTVASGSYDRTVRLWSTATGEQTLKLEGHESWVSAVAISTDGKTVASSSYDRTVRLWSTATGEQTLKLEGHESWVSAVAISADGKTVASGSYDRTVRLWSTATGEQMLKLEGHENWVSAVAISTDGKTVASGSDDNTVRLWSTATGEQMLKLEGHEDVVSAVAISTDGKTVASGSDDKTVRLWSTATGEQMLKLEGHEDVVSAVAISTDGKTVASGSDDNTVRLWSTATGEQTLKLEGHENWVSAVAISTDGKTVASSSYDRTVRLWSTATGEQMLKLEGHEYVVSAVAISTDGKTVASSSYDKTVRLWSTVTGEQIQYFRTRDYPTQICYTDDGNALETNIGLFNISLLSGHNGALPTLPDILVVMDPPWVKYNGSDLLWLPYEYRGFLSATHGAFLIIGQTSGAMSFFSFKPWDSNAY